MRLRLLPRANLAASRCCDAIATSANAGLVGNANPNFWRFTGRLNADGEIHAKAGPKLLAACQEIAASGYVRCNIGETVVTPAFDLHAGVVIHAVAPDGLYAAGLQQWWGRRQWSGNNNARAVHLEEAKPAGEASELLSQTYGAILTAACESSARSVALPAIGCGVLGFPAGRAAKVALNAFANHKSDGGVEKIDVALLDDNAFNAWSRTTRALLGEPDFVGEAGIEVYNLQRLRERLPRAKEGQQ